MGTIIPLTRGAPPAVIKAAATDDSEAREAARSMRILLWTFALTAVAMCATVVVCFSRTWTDVWWISAFLTVFALCKIGLANALFHVMIRYDAERQEARLAASSPPRPDRRVRRRAARSHGAFRAAARAVPSPRPRAPR